MMPPNWSSFTGRTFSTSCIHLEVIQAHGHNGSNQKSTGVTRIAHNNHNAAEAVPVPFASVFPFVGSRSLARRRRGHLRSQAGDMLVPIRDGQGKRTSSPTLVLVTGLPGSGKSVRR